MEGTVAGGLVKREERKVTGEGNGSKAWAIVEIRVFCVQDYNEKTK
jgi:hypothetical protein